MEKYRISNMDCAVCAAKIEDALNRTPGVSDAVVDFGTSTLHVDADDMEKVRRSVEKAAPGAEIEPLSGGKEWVADSRWDREFNTKYELLVMGAAVVLFCLVLAAEYYPGFELPPAVFYVLAGAAYLAAGRRVLASALRTVARRDFFDENVLMTIATAGAMAIGAFSEAVGVMIFYRVGEFFQNLAVFRSRRSIASLLEKRPSYANLKKVGKIERVSPESVLPGDVIVVRPGEKIPLDGRVTQGKSMVDTSVLTGESVPAGAETGDRVLAGGINLEGTLTVEVEKPYSESSIARMAELVENAAARKSPTENFITVFARYYTPAIVFAAIGIAFVPPLLISGATLDQWVYRALVLLVISCPCALVISIPLGYFGGIGRASRQGILVKGSNYLDALAKLNTVVFDKTGTLTKGVFRVKQVVNRNGYSPEEVLEIGAMAEQHSNHPIARAIVEAYRQQGKDVSADRVPGHIEVSGRGVRAELDGKTVLVGNDRYMRSQGIVFDEESIQGTVAHVALGGKYAGCIVIGDSLRDDARQTTESLRAMGVDNIIMLTGDNRQAADHIAAMLHLDGYFADLLPEDKVYALGGIQKENREKGGKKKVAFVGDGINDAPVIAMADVGVAMGGAGSDVAIETADVVLMSDSLSKMAEAVSVGKHTRVIVWQNILIALSVKGVFIALGAAGMASMWAAVFADVGTALIAVLNSTRILGMKI
ncbi:MAG: cadmium-translocating P-type ATPase [Desulfobacteraceae bacterium]|nr:cadmium-translocating P-type ATPase [Desulfobacteraceae bacterium]